MFKRGDNYKNSILLRTAFSSLEYNTEHHRIFFRATVLWTKLPRPRNHDVITIWSDKSCEDNSVVSWTTSCVPNKDGEIVSTKAG